MENSQKDFNQAWHALTTKGEACNQRPRSFIPVGIRKNVKEEGPLYHGTKADLQIGDLITPGYPSNYGLRKKANFVYVTAIKEGAALAAELAAGEGRSKVFVVEPLGEIEDDPNVTDQKFPGNPSRSYRTREPLRIIGIADGWKTLAPDVIEKIRKRMEEAVRLGIEAIND